MSQDQGWYDVLSEAAKSYGVDLSFINSELLKTHGTEIASWVDQHLREASPLTYEELLIWQFIERSKVQLHRDERADPRPKAPLHEKDFQDVVSGLQVRTRSVHAKLQTLKAQDRLIKTHDHIHYNDSTHDISLEKTFEKQQEQERQQIFFMNEESISNLRDKTRLNQEGLERCLKAADTIVKDKLKMDDRILNSLETLTLTESLQCFADQISSRPKMDALQRAIVLSLKTRLDRVYISELIKDVDTEDIGIPDALEQTQNDLQSLYTEIDAVADMLVQKELGSSLEMTEEKLALLIDEAVAQDTSKITNNLANLTESTHQLAANYRLLQACRAVGGEIGQLYLQAQNQEHATSSYEQGCQRAPLPIAPVTLMRHLGIDHQDSSSSTEYTKRLQEKSTSDSDEDRLAISRILTDVRVSIDQIHQQLEGLFEHSRDDLSELSVHNRDLDERIAVAKAKLETTSKNSETSVDGRRRFINAYLSA